MSVSGEDFVTIVSGLPRSGTSMMMRMMEAGGLPVITDKLREADEDNPAGYYEFEPVKGQDHSWLVDAPGKAVKLVYRLLYDLPNTYHYRVLFMRRRLEEVLASQKKMLERHGKADNSITDEMMAKMFRSQLNKFEAWIPTQPQFSMIDVDYNALLANPDGPIDQINRFLGGNLDVDAMVRVVDPNLYRNRK
jgi:hypothetical protein